ncbi:hypothetical protein [Clostridium mediterraneense]|uniref:hypothetical protein n=1 Tax=Clostridium mediterraneense TaxID=1805472 RepID=UPI000831E949|nr:hypothetical protein [Clostridium mediterraneense]
MDNFKTYILEKYKFSNIDYEYIYKVFRDNGTSLIFDSIIRAKSLLGNDCMKVSTIVCDGYKFLFEVDEEKNIQLNILFADDKTFKFEFKEFILLCCDFIKSYYKFKNRIKEEEVNNNLFERRKYTKTTHWKNIYFNKFELLENNILDYEIPLISCFSTNFGVNLDNLNLI